MKWATPKTCVIESTSPLASNRQPDEFLYGDFNSRMSVNEFEGGVVVIPDTEIDDEDVADAERILADDRDRIVPFKPSQR
jgi:hypothetical protein